MGSVKINSNLFIGSLELKKIVNFLSTSGYQLLAKQMIATYGVVNSPNDNGFNNLKIEAGSTPGYVKLKAGYAIDSNIDIINVPSDQDNAIIIPADNVLRYLIIQYQNTNQEVGTVNIAANGTLSGTGTLFTQVLRGQPNFPTKIKFPNSTNNTGEYTVQTVSSDTSVIIVGSGSFVAETNQAYEVVGTFTPSIVPPTPNKDIYNYDSYEIFLQTSFVVTAGLQFILASVKYDGTTLLINELRNDNIFSLDKTIQDSSVNINGSNQLDLTGVDSDIIFVNGSTNTISSIIGFTSNRKVTIVALAEAVGIVASSTIQLAKVPTGTTLNLQAGEAITLYYDLFTQIFYEVESTMKFSQSAKRFLSTDTSIAADYNKLIFPGIWYQNDLASMANASPIGNYASNPLGAKIVTEVMVSTSTALSNHLTYVKQRQMLTNYALFTPTNKQPPKEPIIYERTGVFQSSLSTWTWSNWYKISVADGVNDYNGLQRFVESQTAITLTGSPTTFWQPTWDGNHFFYNAVANGVLNEIADMGVSIIDYSSVTQVGTEITITNKSAANTLSIGLGVSPVNGGISIICPKIQAQSVSQLVLDPGTSIRLRLLVYNSNRVWKIIEYSDVIQKFYSSLNVNNFSVAGAATYSVAATQTMTRSGAFAKLTFTGYVQGGSGSTSLHVRIYQNSTILMEIITDVASTAFVNVGMEITVPNFASGDVFTVQPGNGTTGTTLFGQFIVDANYFNN